MRTCIFCGERASSKEDIWPQWLTRRFASSGASRMFAERGSHRLSPWRTKTSQLLRTKCVCGDCNNGWMSMIENEMKPIANSILDEQLCALEVPSQVVIAVWATKTAMALETLYPERAFFYSEHERKNMRTVSAIPERTFIWVAKCANHSSIYSEGGDLRTSAGDNEVTACVTTMAFGSLAFQVLSIRAPASLSKETQITYDTREGPWSKVLLQVWPLHYSQEWPPSHGLNGEQGLQALAERLNPETSGQN